MTLLCMLNNVLQNNEGLIEGQMRLLEFTPCT